MKIVSGATASDGRHISVELEESDIEGDLPTNVAAKHKKMMQVADILVVKYFVDAEIFTADYGKQRMKEIQSR